MRSTLRWDGCLNVRDLGGQPTEDGGTTRWERVVRSDSVGKLSPAGWDALVAYGIRTVVDLRFDDERAADPPHSAPVDVVHVSLLGERDSDWLAGLDERAAAEPDEVASTRLVYLDMLETHAERFVDAVTAVADAPEGGVLVHCHGGKDRTGLVVALLLRLCGVPLDAIDADYAATEARLLGRFDPDTAAAPAGAMAAVLADLERTHGSVEEYLAGCGLTREARARLRERLLAPLEVVPA